MPNKTDQERCAGAGADHAQWLVPEGACEVAPLPALGSLLGARRTVLNEMRSIQMAWFGRFYAKPG